MIATLPPYLAQRFEQPMPIRKGGFGVLIRAHDRARNCEVAIKLPRWVNTEDEGASNVLTPDVHGEHPDARGPERLEREGVLSKLIDNEHVVRVYEVGAAPDSYVIYEYLEGHDLLRYAAKHEIRTTEAVGYVLQACLGLASAHRHLILHRDIKLDNLFRLSSPDGFIKIIDFGLAKTSAFSSLTAAGMLVGNPEYMSPEQIRWALAQLTQGPHAEPPDERTDIWSLGVVLYRLLTGVAPFSGANPAEVVAAVLNQRPKAPVELVPRLAHQLNEVTMRCLRSFPENRYRDVAELAAALEPHGPEHLRGYAERVKAVLHEHERRIQTIGSDEHLDVADLRSRFDRAWENAEYTAVIETGVQLAQFDAGANADIFGRIAKSYFELGRSLETEVSSHSPENHQREVYDKYQRAILFDRRKSVYHVASARWLMRTAIYPDVASTIEHHLSAALEIDPSASDVLEARARIRASRGQLAGALADCDQALKATGARSGPQVSSLYLLRADCCESLGLTRETAWSHDMAVASDPLSVSALHARASFRHACGNGEAAARDIESAISLASTADKETLSLLESTALKVRSGRR